MKLDDANRSFLGLMAPALLGIYLLCGALGTVLIPLVLARISHVGLITLTTGGSSLLPAFLVITVVALALALGGRSIARQMLASRRLAIRVRELTRTLPNDVARAATEAGLNGRVVLLDSPERFSFTFGVLDPRVAISHGLHEDISPIELRAVLEHERYHVCNLDPLKVLLMRALSATFFLLPALDSLGARYLAGRELAADRRAIKACGRGPLAGALLKATRGPDWDELAGVAALRGKELLEVRVAQLETGVEPQINTLHSMRLVLSFLGAALFAGGLLTSVSAVGGTAAMHQMLDGRELLSAAICALPFAAAGAAAYSMIVRRARLPTA